MDHHLVFDTTTTPSPTVGCGANIDDVFDLSDSLRVKCILVISLGVISLMFTTTSVGVFARFRKEIGHPIVEALMYSILLAIPATINVMIAASFRLSDTDAFRAYCNISGYVTQQIEIPELMMECAFFSAMGWTLIGGTVTSKGMRRLFVGSLLLGTVGGFVPMATLPTKDTTHSVFGAATPWCWFPTYDICDNGVWKASSLLNTYKLIFGYIWTFVSFLFGGITTILIIRRSFQEGRGVSSVLKFRIAYYVIFTVIWTFCLIPRYFGDMLSSETVLNLEYALVVAIPGVPLINAALFLLLDCRKLWWTPKPTPTRGSSPRTSEPPTENAYDVMARLGKSQTRLSLGPNERLALNDSADASLLNNEPSGHLHAPPPLPKGATHGSHESLTAPGSSQQAALSQRTFHARYDEENTQWVVTMPNPNAGASADRTPQSRDDTLGAPGAFPADPVMNDSLLLLKDDPQLEDIEAALRMLLGVNAVVSNLPSLPKPPIGVALSFVAGYCDALGFIGLGLFTAHVTGNIVLAGVNIAKNDITNVPDIIEKVVAIMVFCLVIAAAHTASFFVKQHRRVLLFSQAFLFLLSFIFAKKEGPFNTSKEQLSWGGYMTSMLMVAGMAVQNSYQRSYLVGLPLTAFMTGNTNQVVHDIVEIVRKKYRREPKDTLTANYTRLRNSGMNVLSFFIGASLATLALKYLSTWAGLPPVLAVCAILTLFWDETAAPQPKPPAAAPALAAAPPAAIVTAPDTNATAAVAKP